MAITDLLGVDVGRILWQIVNFIILLLILNRLLFKPVLRMMDRRADQIRTSIDEATRMQKLADEIRQMNDAAVEEARQQAAQILENANRQAEQFRESQMDNARKEAALFVDRARDEIRLERDQAIADVRRQAVDLAIQAAGKVVEAELDPAKHRELVTRLLAEAGAGPSRN